MINRLALVALTFVLMTATTARAATVFAQTGQNGTTNQFMILQNPAGIVTISTALGSQDYFDYLVGGTPFSAPVLANFALSVTSNQTGACGSLTCPNGDTLTEQGYHGTFSYTVAGGAYNGDNLLSGTFNVNGTPTNSGGKLGATIGGTQGNFDGTQTAGNLNGIVFTSDFLNFAGVTVETGSWGLSALSPSFSVDPTVTGISLPALGTTFSGANVGSFSSQQAPTVVPEPVTILLLGSSLVGLGLIRRKRLLHLRKSA
jgi:hypothetical protein